MVMNRKPLAAVAVGALLVTVAGCGGGSSSGGGNDSAEGTKGGTLYHLTERSTEHTDPSRTYVGRDIFNFNRTVYRSWVSAPVTTDEKEAATVVPDLATDSGTANADKTVWKFTVRDGVKWEDGKPITCEDFKYGVSRNFATNLDGGPKYAVDYLDIPKKPADAVKTILGKRRRRIDVGRITVDGTERCFTVACGIGYDAEVMDKTTPPQKLRWGKLAYLANAVGQADELHAVKHVLTIDGTRMETEASQVFVANQGKMLPIVAPRRKIRPDDGKLDVIVVRASGALPALLAGWDAMVQEDLGNTDSGRVFRTQAREIEIETEPGRLVEVDGSVIGSTPVSIKVDAKALIVLVPK